MNSIIKIDTPISKVYYRQFCRFGALACMTRTLSACFFLLMGLILLSFLNTAVLALDKPDFAALKSKWVRTDGGYVIEIQSIGADGQMQAAYYNPNPIHVSRAEAKRSGEAVTVFIELRAPGYPGSTYTLIHDPKSDELKGVYYQAVLQQDFDVIFVRSKSGK